LVGLHFLWFNGVMSIFLSVLFANIRALVAEFKLGSRRVGVRTDGGLQILIPGVGNQFLEWDRSYYEIGLEVLFFLVIEVIVGKTLLQNNQCGWRREY
jgi:hypothetical protein